MGHIVDNRYDLPLREPACGNPHTAEPEDGEDADVHDEGSERIRERRKPAHRDGAGGVAFARFFKTLFFLFHPCKGTDDADARKVFPRGGTDGVQLFLELFIQRDGFPHDNGEHSHEQRDRHEQHKGNLKIDQHAGDEAADAQEGGADDQADEHGNGELELVHIACDAGGKRGGAEAVQLAVGKGADVAEKVVAQLRAEPLRRNGRGILAEQRAAEAAGGKQEHERAHAEHIGRIPVFDAEIDEPRHDERNNQLEYGFQELEKRA